MVRIMRVFVQITYQRFEMILLNALASPKEVKTGLIFVKDNASFKQVGYI